MGYSVLHGENDFLKAKCQEFPGGPVVRTPCFHCGGRGSTPGRGTKIPQASRRGQKKKKKPIVSLNAHQKGAKRRHVPGYEAKQAYTIYWTHKMFC